MAPPTLTPEAEEAKKQGNDCAKNGKHIEAMLHYSKAIKLAPKEATLYSNRSLMFLKMQQYYHALEDAQTCIKLNPKWQKGYFRQGEVQFAAEHYQDALWSYKQALNISPDDETLYQSVNKASSHLNQQRKKDSYLPTYGFGVGFLIGTLIIIANEFLVSKSALESPVLKVLILLAIGAIGYAGGYGYRLIQQNMRASMLEAPLDIYGDMNNSSEQNNSSDKGDGTETMKTRTRRSQGAARQRMKQAKS